MRTWFKEHPNAALVACLLMVVVSSLNLLLADTTPGRIWSVLRLVTFSAWAVYWWYRT